MCVATTTTLCLYEHAGTRTSFYVFVSTGHFFGSDLYRKGVIDFKTTFIEDNRNTCVDEVKVIEWYGTFGAAVSSTDVDLFEELVARE